MVEMMVTSTLGLLLIGTLIGLLSVGRMVWQDAETKIATVQEVRKGLSEIALDLPRASWSSPAADCPEGITVDGDTLCFRIPQSISGSTITWGDTILYSRDWGTNQLIRENLTTGERRVVANFISNITFSTLPDPHQTVVRVIIWARKRSLSTRTFQSSLRTNFAVRN